MEDAPLPNIELTPKKLIPEVLEIKQNNKSYKLLIEIEEFITRFKIIEDDPFLGTYSRIFTMKEIKELHHVFSMFNSFQEFLDYLRALGSKKKIEIKQTEDYISIILNVEYLLKHNIIEINLTQEDMNYKLISKQLKKEINLLNEKINDMEIKYKYIIIKQKEDNTNLIEENSNIKQRLNILEKENKKIKEKFNECITYINLIKNKNNEKNNNEIVNNNMINSSIMDIGEFDMIKIAISERMKKEIKKIKKLYQATINGADAFDFHVRCDNVPNTLILIKSEGNRRFGGFTSECWESNLKSKYDKNAFLFSLDKKKIYNVKNDNYSICCYTSSGPCFGKGNTIRIGKNILLEKGLKTYESYSQCSYEFNGDINALSEDGKNEGISAKDYEVYQVIF